MIRMQKVITRCKHCPASLVYAFTDDYYSKMLSYEHQQKRRQWGFMEASSIGLQEENQSSFSYSRIFFLVFSFIHLVYWSWLKVLVRLHSVQAYRKLSGVVIFPFEMPVEKTSVD